MLHYSHYRKGNTRGQDMWSAATTNDKDKKIGCFSENTKQEMFVQDSQNVAFISAGQFLMSKAWSNRFSVFPVVSSCIVLVRAATHYLFIFHMQWTFSHHRLPLCPRVFIRQTDGTLYLRCPAGERGEKWFYKELHQQKCWYFTCGKKFSYDLWSFAITFYILWLEIT